MKPGISEIALKAYQLWKTGRHESGRDQEHWLQAEAELMAAGQVSAKSVEARPRPDVSVGKSELVAQRKSKTSEVNGIGLFQF